MDIGLAATFLLLGLGFAVAIFCQIFPILLMIGILYWLFK